MVVGSVAGRVSPEKRRSNWQNPLPSHSPIHPSTPRNTTVSLVVSGVSSLLFLLISDTLGDKPGPFPQACSLLSSASIYANFFSASPPRHLFDSALGCRPYHERQRPPETMTPCARSLSMHEPQAQYSSYMRTLLNLLGLESIALFNPTLQSTTASRANTHTYTPTHPHTHTKSHPHRSPTPQPWTLDCALPSQTSSSHHSQPNGLWTTTHAAAFPELCAVSPAGALEL